MTASPADLAVERIHTEMALLLELVPHSKWYLFGSILRDKRPVNDIDVLVVCPNDPDCEKIRFGLAAACSEFPIHLLLMTRAEEAEVKFIEGECAVQIGCPTHT